MSGWKRCEANKKELSSVCSQSKVSELTPTVCCASFTLCCLAQRRHVSWLSRPNMKERLWQSMPNLLWTCFADPSNLCLTFSFNHHLNCWTLWCIFSGSGTLLALTTPQKRIQDSLSTWPMLNSKEWLICSKLLELFLRLVLWKQTENNFFLLVLTVLPVRHQLGKHCT